MIYPYSVNKFIQNIFLQIFTENVNLETYPVLANFLKTELCFFEKLRYAVVVNSEENYNKLEMWKTELILHGIYIHAKVCTDYNCALDYIGLNELRLF